MIQYTFMDNDRCVFCKIVNKEIPSKIVFEDGAILAFEDVNPQAPFHIVIIPKFHVAKMSDMEDQNIDLAGRLLIAAKKIARDIGVEDSGYRVVMNCNKDGGQEIDHLHLHLLGGRQMRWPPG